MMVATAMMLVAGRAGADMIETTGIAPWEACGECHGLDGANPMPRFPKLAGQPAMYLEKQVRDFLSGARANDGGQMTAVVTELAPEDITGVAAYFAMLPTPVPSNDAPTDPQAAVANVLVEHGRPEAGLLACRSCHLPGAAVPQLEAQHRAYLVKQLLEFRSGGRVNDPTGMMTEIARQLSESDIEALATYLAARPRPPAPNGGGKSWRPSRPGA